MTLIKKQPKRKSHRRSLLSGPNLTRHPSSLSLALALLLLCTGVTGCGKIADEDTASTNTSEESTSSDSSGDSASSDGSTSSDTDDEPETTPTVNTLTLTSEEAYSDTYRRVEVLGLKEYKKIKGEDYTDKPAKGNVYLVLFLDIWNYSEDSDYINYNCLTATVDGEEIENTYLLNDPEGYTTILTTIDASAHAGGFIVWEVPEDWEELTFSYNGWEHINYVILDAAFTHDDLSDPVEYNEMSYR